MPDIIAIGEAIIDFIPTTMGKGLEDTPAFEKRPGGAPANVAVGVARLGGSSGFIGKFGQDEFGHFLHRTLKENSVDTKSIVFTGQAKTGLAFVTLKENGEREFIFYREPCADVLLTPEEIDEDYIKGAKVLHFGTISLIAEPGRSATYRAVQLARQADKVVSLDVNLREPLWPSLEAARREITAALKLAHIVKVSEEELAFIVGEYSDLEEGAAKLLALGPNLVLVTLGEAGSFFKTSSFSGKAAGISVRPVDTTGAGDAFTAAMLCSLVEAGVARHKQIAAIPPERMVEFCRLANAAGAFTCTKNGAISALPTRAEAEKLLR